MTGPARLLPLLLLALLTSACATVVRPPDPPAPAVEPSAPAPAVAPAPVAHGTVQVYVTFYGGPDNDPRAVPTSPTRTAGTAARAAPAATPTRSRWPPTPARPTAACRSAHERTGVRVRRSRPDHGR